MRILSQLPNRVVFMDAGLTLFETQTLYGNKAPSEGFMQVPALRWQKEDTAVRARPSARAALEQLKDKGEFVIVLTGGPLESAEAWLKAIGLDELVEGILGSGGSWSLNLPQFWVLVDDAPGKEKVALLLGYRKETDMPEDEYQATLVTRVVSCHRFFMGDDRRPLTAEVDQIVRLLDAQTTA